MNRRMRASSANRRIRGALEAHESAKKRVVAGTSGIRAVRARSSYRRCSGAGNVAGGASPSRRRRVSADRDEERLHRLDAAIEVLDALRDQLCAGKLAAVPGLGQCHAGRIGDARACAGARPPTLGYAAGMCRNIKTLHNFEPPATEDEIRGAALQYVRKVSGSQKPSQANEAAFARAVDEIAARDAPPARRPRDDGVAARPRARGRPRAGACREALRPRGRVERGATA